MQVKTLRIAGVSHFLQKADDSVGRIGCVSCALYYGTVKIFGEGPDDTTASIRLVANEDIKHVRDALIEVCKQLGIE